MSLPLPMLRATCAAGAAWAIRLALVIALGSASGLAAAGPSDGEFLAVSDIHFDPLADPSLADQLAAAPAEGWPAILARGKTAPSRFGEDTNWPLLHSALERMRAVLPQPAFVLAPGDFLAHRYREKFDKSASDHSDAAFRGFVGKSMQVVAGRLRAAFPETPILAALGNNDADCGDYRLQPGGPFLADTLPIVRGLLRGAPGPEFDADWSALGNYDVVHPTRPRIRVLIVNTVYFSRSYRNSCGSGDPAAQTLEWLRAALDRARRDGRKAWLAYHIPPGIDVHATLHDGGCPDRIVPMWEPASAARFTELAHEFADTIEASFAGHTHMDEFRLIGKRGARDGFVLVVPALSPIFGQNPAFQVLAYDGAGILDRATYYLANPAAATPALADWRAEPPFSEAWQLPRITAGTLEALDDRIGSDRDAAARWLLRYAVSRAEFWPSPPQQGLPLPAALAAYRCAIGSPAIAEFRTCACP